MKTVMIVVTLSGSLALLSACSLLNRSPESGYAGDSRKLNTTTIRKTSRVTDAGPLDRANESISEKTRMKQLENSLSTRKETEQYSKALPWFKNEEERMDFLRLPGFEARQQWLSEKNFSSRALQVNSTMKELVESNDIAVGMPQGLVRQAWGDPDNVEVSGNPQFKNERWLYQKFISTQDGYKPERKIVYFEGGKVVGWEIE